MKITRAIDAAMGSKVWVEGRIVPSHEGTFLAPLGNDAVVWCQVVTQSRSERSYAEAWNTVSTAIDGRAFFVDDESGLRAWIDPRRSMHLAPLPGGRETDACDPPLARFLADHEPDRVPMGSSADTDRSRYVQTVLREGDRVRVVGRVHQERVLADTVTSYRAGEELVLAFEIPSVELVSRREG